MKETGIDGNCPTWPHASKVYSRAYRVMREQGPDVELIYQLDKGNEHGIKRRMLEMNTELVFARAYQSRTKG